MSRAAVGVDLDALAAWLREHLGPGDVGPFEHLGGGTQNQLLRVTHRGRPLVVRLPPVHKRSNSDETMRREALVLRALAGTDVPHPRLVAAEPAPEVLGWSFVVMEAVDGILPVGHLSGRYGSDPAWRSALGPAMVDAIARLGRLDPTQVGLDALARPGSFVGRQAARWRAQVESYAGTPGYVALDGKLIDRIATWLSDHQPPDQTPGIVHGDYHPANVLVSTSFPRVAAVLDWELATVGDPLLDLGELLVTWPDADGASLLGSLTGMYPADGLAREADLVAAYAEVSVRDLGALAWYKVLACFRLAAIIEGTWARACAGLADRATGAALHTNALALLARAEQVMTSA